VACPAEGVRPLADDLPLLSCLESRWSLATDQRQARGKSQKSRRTRVPAHRSDHRQSVSEDDSKKGVRGYDAGKKVKGRKRHLIVDTMGLVLSVLVHRADIQDRDGAKLSVEQIKRHLRCLKVVFADGGYAGQLVNWFKETVGWKLEIVKRSDQASGFEVLPKRWIVERTFGWLNLYRRHSKDYEELTEHSEAMIYITMIRLMTRRLARQAAS